MQEREEKDERKRAVLVGILQRGLARRRMRESQGRRGGVEREMQKEEGKEFAQVSFSKGESRSSTWQGTSFGHRKKGRRAIWGTEEKRPGR